MPAVSREEPARGQHDQGAGDREPQDRGGLGRRLPDRVLDLVHEREEAGGEKARGDPDQRP